MHEVVSIDESVSHIDVLLLANQESWRDGMRWVGAMHKALRLSRIDERSLVLTDLSSLPGDHQRESPPAGSELELPYDVMDIYDNEPQLFGRNHNPANFALLRSELTSREHFSITPHLGEAGLRLAIRDERSVNGSSLRVHHLAPELARH
jgi:hypothetical protein